LSCTQPEVYRVSPALSATAQSATRLCGTSRQPLPDSTWCFLQDPPRAESQQELPFLAEGGLLHLIIKCGCGMFPLAALAQMPIIGITPKATSDGSFPHLKYQNRLSYFTI